MNPGTLRHRFTLEAPRETPDGAGGFSRVFVRITDIWGLMHAIRKTNGYEALALEREGQQRLYFVATRYASVITAGHRLRLSQRLFDIRSVADPDGLREQLHLIVEESAA